MNVELTIVFLGWILACLGLLCEYLRRRRLMMLSIIWESLPFVGNNKKIKYNKEKILRECPSLKKNGYDHSQEVRRDKLQLLKDSLNDLGNIQTKDSRRH